ncbi:YafY family transcriptional regulator [Clostridium sp. 19966]|uniref:helix-turn-helix transcriptional regulator n=1 Tax=Clostridium sp. 19966 TaxID=2768166 RepID=UPI0028E0176F|nr:YafY family protein [Clostridium sp. 19966]MDT8719325.1 YafY family transcriptional regulator [Clostridium sp. 19966]
MKIDRLLAITIYLLNHKKVSAKVFAEKFEVSIRTIQRDMEALCEAGIPVVSSLGAEGGYEILQGFRMEKQIAKKEDYSYIITALQALTSAYNSPKLDLTLEKIKAIQQDNEIDSNMLLDFSVLREDKAINYKLEILEKAIAEKRIVAFSYTNGENMKSVKEVEPIAVNYRWYAWYLLAYSLEKQDYRLYKLIRMENLKMTAGNMRVCHEPASVLLRKSYEKDTRKYIDIKLLCKEEVKVKAAEYLRGDIEKEYENGDFIMKLHLPESEDLWFGTLLSFGSLVTVLEPKGLKEKICNRCREILDLYYNL